MLIEMHLTQLIQQVMSWVGIYITQAEEQMEAKI